MKQGISQHTDTHGVTQMTMSAPEISATSVASITALPVSAVGTRTGTAGLPVEVGHGEGAMTFRFGFDDPR
jgi:hypothetical protein